MKKNQNEHVCVWIAHVKSILNRAPIENWNKNDQTRETKISKNTVSARKRIYTKSVRLYMMRWQTKRWMMRDGVQRSVQVNPRTSVIHTYGYSGGFVTHPLIPLFLLILNKARCKKCQKGFFYFLIVSLKKINNQIIMLDGPSARYIFVTLDNFFFFCCNDGRVRIERPLRLCLFHFC